MTKDNNLIEPIRFLYECVVCKRKKEREDVEISKDDNEYVCNTCVDLGRGYSRCDDCHKVYNKVESDNGNSTLCADCYEELEISNDPYWLGLID